MRLKILAAILFIFICILPGSKAGFFNGLPFSAIETIFSIVAILAIFATPWEKIKTLKIIILSCFLIFLIFQALSSKLLPYGWSVCVYSESSRKPLQSNCEPSVEDPRGNISYIYPDVNFTSKNMPLYFINSTGAFGFYKPGQPNRNKLPFTVNTFSYVYSRGEDHLRIRSDKDVFIEINDKQYIYKPEQKEAKILLNSDTINLIRTSYSSNINKNNILSLKTDSQPFYKYQKTYSENLVSVYRTLNYFFLLILTACFIYAYTIKFLTLDKKNQLLLLISTLFLLTLIILIYTKTLKFKELTIYFHLITIFVSLIFVTANKLIRNKLLPFIFLIILASSLMLVSYRIAPEETKIFSGGNDELSHEHLAREFVPVASIQDFTDVSGTELFYYQPLHRYFLFSLHKFFGEPMWGPYVIQTVLFNMAIILTIYALSESIGLLSALFFCALYLLLFTINPDHNIIRLLLSPLQQAIALPLLIFGIAMTVLFFKHKKERKDKLYFILGLILGASFMIRTDWSPVIFILIPFIFYTLWINFNNYKWIKNMSFLLLSFFIFPLFIGSINYYVAEKFVILPTSGYVNLLGYIKESIKDKVDFHESSGIKIMTEIIISFSGRYDQLVKIIWNNINESIIGKNILHRLIWCAMFISSILSIFITIKNKINKILVRQIFFLLLILAAVFSGSFFKQHNGIAMKGIYNYLVISVLASNMQVLLSSWKKLNLWYKKIIYSLKNLISNFFISKLK